MGLNKKYDGYQAYQYLEAGKDYLDLKMAKGLDRVPQYLVPLTKEEEGRVLDLAERLIIISLHDHPVYFPENMEDVFAYNRQGRQICAYEELSHSYLDAVFDNMMDGTCTISSQAGWKWNDILHDLGMRFSDLAHQDFVIRCERVVHPLISIVYNTDVFAEDSVVDMAGMGIRNFWTYINIEPTGDQKAIILNSNDTVQAINPFYISGSVDSWVYELVYDRLMRMSPEGLPEPWAAESVEWLSDTEVKIVLRDGMQWHDGQPVTAEDVKFSFEAPMTGEVPMYKPFVDVISKIEIVDDGTLVFYLERPWAAFEAASLAKINLAPKHIWGPIFEDLQTRPENAESIQEDVPIGSGPFKFADWKFAEEVVLDAYTDHFAAPKADKWIVRFISNMESTLGMIQNGELNFLASYSGDASLLENMVNRSPVLSMVSSVDLGFRFIALNHNRAPFNDPAFRKALVAITDQEFVVEAVWKGYAVPANSVIAPALEYWKNDQLEWPQGGIEQARQFLEDAGYEWDNRGRLLYPAGHVEEHTPTF